METRLNEVEAKIALAEDMIETLNQTVIRQQGQIDLMQRQIHLLHQQLKAAQTEDSRPPRDEIPPHY